MIWKIMPDLDFLNNLGASCLPGHLDIKFEEVGHDYMVASMPVDKRTMQPMGLLHGGASVVLAETLGSVASHCCIDLVKNAAVGLEVNANHLSSALGGRVFGRVTPIKLGRTIHVWNIKISDETEKIICSSRLTVMILQSK